MQLGVNAVRLKRRVFVAAALLTGTVVAFTGPIGFVGLVVPHMLRGVLGQDNRLLVPTALVGGGIFLLAADTLARNVVAPAELSVGVITSFCGAPFFIYLLRARYRTAPVKPPRRVRRRELRLSPAASGGGAWLRRPGVVRRRRGRDLRRDRSQRAGKTTLLRLLSRVVTPARGEIRLDGRAMRGSLEHAELARADRGGAAGRAARRSRSRSSSSCSWAATRTRPAAVLRERATTGALARGGHGGDRRAATWRRAARTALGRRAPARDARAGAGPAAAAARARRADLPPGPALPGRDGGAAPAAQRRARA